MMVDDDDEIEMNENRSRVRFQENIQPAVPQKRIKRDKGKTKFNARHLVKDDDDDDGHDNDVQRERVVAQAEPWQMKWMQQVCDGKELASNGTVSEALALFKRRSQCELELLCSDGLSKEEAVDSVVEKLASSPLDNVNKKDVELVMRLFPGGISVDGAIRVLRMRAEIARLRKESGMQPADVVRTLADRLKIGKLGGKREHRRSLGCNASSSSSGNGSVESDSHMPDAKRQRRVDNGKDDSDDGGDNDALIDRCRPLSSSSSSSRKRSSLPNDRDDDANGKRRRNK
jgi:hypothetical protein